MTTEELAERAYNEVLDDEWKLAQEREEAPGELVSWGALNRDLKHQYLEAAEKGGDASVFGQKVVGILKLRARAETVALPEPGTEEAVATASQAAAGLIPDPLVVDPEVESVRAVDPLFIEPPLVEAPAETESLAESESLTEADFAEPVNVSGEAPVAIEDAIDAPVVEEGAPFVSEAGPAELAAPEPKKKSSKKK